MPDIWETCGDCSALIDKDGMLIGALASVGIEHKKSIRQMALEYFASFHAGGHRRA